jgi:hypothetical protein
MKGIDAVYSLSILTFTGTDWHVVSLRCRDHFLQRLRTDANYAAAEAYDWQPPIPDHPADRAEAQVQSVGSLGRREQGFAGPALGLFDYRLRW